MTCPVCGSTNFTQNKVLWPELVAEWELQPHERDYIDEQQGFHCLRCQANLRAMTLACAIMTAFNFNGLFSTWVDRSRLAILEINEAYTLTSFTSRVPGHVLAKYPDVDMHALPYRDGKFDLVLHSDTLEHVQDPVSALSECRRVLKPDGCMVYTIPIIVGRMSRSRIGMPPSYHGTPETPQNDHLVFTEFGADFWDCPMRAGFNRTEIVSLRYPASLAIIARRSLA